MPAQQVAESLDAGHRHPRRPAAGESSPSLPSEATHAVVPLRVAAPVAAPVAAHATTHATAPDAVGERLRRPWSDPAGRTVVRAVLVESTDSAHRAAIGRRVVAPSRGATLFLGDLDGALHFVTRDERSDADLDDRITASVTLSGTVLTAVGVAGLEAGEPHLVAAGERARTAARLTAVLPELQPVGRFENLGHWLLLSRLAAGSVRPGEISPAAALLAQPGNEVCRETVEAYLDAAGRTTVACARLHVHRTTLYYRLENAPAAVRDELADGMRRSSLHLALKLHRVRAALGAA